MSIPGFKECEIDKLIYDERVDDKFPSTREIFRVIHPLLQAECLSLARRYKKHLSKDPTFSIPSPFNSTQVVDTMYERWGGKDKIKHFCVWEKEGRTGWEIVLYSHGMHLMSIEDGNTGKLLSRQADLSPMGKAVVVAGGLDEAAFIEFLKSFPFNPENTVPGLEDFYYNRMRRAANLRAFGAKRPRLSDGDITLIVESYNWIPSYMASK